MIGPPPPRVVRFLSLLALAAALCWTGRAPAQQKTKKALEPYLKSSPQVLAAFREVVAKPRQSTVRVRCDGSDAALGAVVAKDGWILTKASDLKGTMECVLPDGRKLEARLVGVHEAFDLAMLKVEADGLVPVHWRESAAASVGSWVASVGIKPEPVAIGIVSVAARDLPILKGPRRPARAAGFLGVSMEPADDGIKVNRVIPGSGAAKAGLKSDDIILAAAEKMISKPEALVELIMNFKPGDTIRLRIRRGDKELEVKATLGRRPLNRSDFQNRLGSELSERRHGFPRVLQHDSILKPHDCGGPLVDLDGNVVGINIARAGRTESFAIPAEAILPLLDDLKSGKLAPKNSEELERKIAAARAALEKAEAEKADLEKRLAQAEKKVDEARKALERARAQAKPAGQ